jgi:hypothetical protein
MPSTDPKNINITLLVMRAGFMSGLLTKEEIISWADTIITKEDEPPIFFIDLALSGSKSKHEILHYINDQISIEKPFIPGRPLLGMLCKRYQLANLTLEQTVKILYQLNFEVSFTSEEESCIYSIDYSYDLAKDNIQGTMQSVRDELENFLAIYKDYSFDNVEQWHVLDTAVDIEIEKKVRYPEQPILYNYTPPAKDKKSWWKFWVS